MVTEQAADGDRMVTERSADGDRMAAEQAADGDRMITERSADGDGTADGYGDGMVREYMTDILVVEDNQELAQLLCSFLREEYDSVMTADSGEKAVKLFESHRPRLVILDIMLPGMDGYAVCKKIRDTGDTPVLIVSAKTQKEDQLKGLLLGADDYIEKPYDIDIMMAKIRNIFRHRYSRDEITDGDLCANRASRSVYKAKAVLELTAKEFDLLWLLMDQKGKVLRKDYIFDKIWGMDSFSEPQTLTVHIKRLRQKIEKDPKRPDRIITVWGIGYQFREHEE